MGSNEQEKFRTFFGSLHKLRNFCDVKIQDLLSCILASSIIGKVRDYKKVINTARTVLC